MRKITAALLALGLSFAVLLGLSAPATASTNYQAKTCYVGSLRFQVTSWIDGTSSKTYHWSASQISGSYPWAYATFGGVKRTAREGYITFTSTGNRWSYGHWYRSGGGVTYCGVYL